MKQSPRSATGRKFVFGRGLESARAFAKRFHATIETPIYAIRTVKEALKGVDLVVLVTTAAEPIVQFEWFAQGGHLCEGRLGNG